MNLSNFLKKVLTLFSVVVIIVCFLKLVKAGSGDYWSVGYDRTNDNEILRLDSSGFLIPGKDNTYDLGTSALSWGSLYLDGTATIGKAVITTNSVPASYYLVGAVLKTIVPSSSYIVLSTASNITMTAIPTISTGSSIPSGMQIILTSTATTVAFQDNDVLSGSFLELGASTRTVGPNIELCLRYEEKADKWVECGFSDSRYTGFSIPSTTFPRISHTPGAAGKLIFNSTISALCLSTGTVATSWALSSATSTVCQ